MIHVKDLSYIYKSDSKLVVKGVNFNVEQGEIFGFLGPSGAGKSTTQKILSKQLSHYKGSIKVNNKDLKSWNGNYFETIGVGFELPNHYLKLTARENLEFFSSFYRSTVEKPEKLLKMVGLFADMDKKVEGFSKGMKMRLNFVRAIMHNPDIVFLDEPTSGLDPVNARIIKDIIFGLKEQGKTIFLTTHNMHDADELCDRVAFIVDGELKLIDSPKSMKLHHGRRTLIVEHINGEKSYDEFDLDTLNANEEFIKVIKTSEIVSIHSQEATLDEIFIKTTGAAL